MTPPQDPKVLLEEETPGPLEVPASLVERAIEAEAEPKQRCETASSGENINAAP